MSLVGQKKTFLPFLCKIPKQFIHLDVTSQNQFCQQRRCKYRNASQVTLVSAQRKIWVPKGHFFAYQKANTVIPASKKRSISSQLLFLQPEFNKMASRGLIQSVVSGNTISKNTQETDTEGYIQ